jgi:hypothetical protein
MSDAQLPPDTVEGEGDPSRPPRAHDDAAGMMARVRFEALQVLPADDSASDAQSGENDPAPDAAIPSTNADTPAHENASDDSQPMLDLRLPDSPPLEPSLPPEEAVPVALEPLDAPLAASSHQEPGSSAIGLDVSAPLETRAEEIALVESMETGQQAHSDAGGAAAAADIPAEIVPVEISPIFSALDAAERHAETARERTPAPEPEAFDTGSILLPRSQWVEIEEQPAAPADSLQAAESPAAEPLAGDADPDPDAASATDAAASSEAPQEPDAPPHADEQAPPAEVLQDAAARIAAEASATAAALENLKRLLVHNRAEPDIAALHNLLEPKPERTEPSPERTEPPPIPVYRPPARLPITPPPMVEPPQAASSLSPFPDDDMSPRRPIAAVGSFFAGFALSWVLGAVLYVLLTAG